MDAEEGDSNARLFIAIDGAKAPLPHDALRLLLSLVRVEGTVAAWCVRTDAWDQKDNLLVSSYRWTPKSHSRT